MRWRTCVEGHVIVGSRGSRRARNEKITGFSNLALPKTTMFWAKVVVLLGYHMACNALLFQIHNGA